MTEMVAGISKASIEREAAMMEASSNFIWARKIRALRAALDKAEAERDRLRALPAVQPAHVNETPKSEHVPGDVLTPATKDDWQPIETAPKRRVIDLWSQEGERYPDAVWGVCGDTEGWTDANDHRSLEGFTFTNWRDRPVPPATKGGDA